MSFELITTDKVDTAGIVVVQMQNKPSLANDIEKPVLRQYPYELRNTNTLGFVTWALNLLGVNHKEGAEDHHAAVYEYVNTRLLGYTYEELKTAMMMYVEGQFEGLMVTQQFNAVVMGRIIFSYDIHKKNVLAKYREEKQRQKAEQEAKENELTPEEKMKLSHQGVNNCFNEYISKGKIIDGYVWVYDYLVKNKLIQNTDQEKKDIYKEEQEKILNKPKPYGMTRDAFKMFIREIEQSRNETVIVACKNRLLAEYLDRLVVTYGDQATKELIKKLTDNNNYY